MNKYIVIVGATCSGKTTLVNRLVNVGYSRMITSTTRPIRDDEVDGVDYHFKPEIKGEEYILKTTYNNFDYALSKHDIKECGIIVLDCDGVSEFLNSVDNKDITVIFLKKPKWLLKRRLKKRLDYSVRIGSLNDEIKNNNKLLSKLRKNSDIQLIVI